MQVVGYRSRVEQPAALLVAENGRLSTERLVPGSDLSYTLGERYCAGTIDEDSHIACDADRAPYCDAHTDRWPCARCRGDCSMPLETCHEEHAIYLAAFAPATFKVGVTRSWRLDRRLREQGADRAAHLRTVADGRVARQVEAEIAADVGDRVRIPIKIAGLHQTVNEDIWQALLDQFEPIETFAFEYGLSLSARPLAETLLSGTVVGTQGRVLVLENGDSAYAVDLKNLVGYELLDGRTDRNLQSDLGAFR
ncbi:DUF2797 domain-containing protein [Halobacteriales archaeon QS_4_62_28]|nr:MAG: DUF2797 domain-containing protein [Halobacteriales archaeon QS_4_62_28]